MKWLVIGILTIVMIGCCTINDELETSNSFCPKCKSNNVARIEYGLIDLNSSSSEFKEKVRKGEVILGGCVVGPENCHCNNCGYEWEYRNENMK